MSESQLGRQLGRLFLRWPRSLTGRSLTGGARLGGAGLLVAIGVIHFLLAPRYYPVVMYIGFLFYMTAIGTWLTAIAIVVGLRGAWILGGLIAFGALASLVLSATVGLPSFADSFSAPWAMLSLWLEGVFVALYVGLALLRRNLFLTSK